MERRRTEAETARRVQIDAARRRNEDEKKRIREERQAVESELKRRRTERLERKNNIVALKEAKLHASQVLLAASGASSAEGAVAALLGEDLGNQETIGSTETVVDEADRRNDTYYEDDFEDENDEVLAEEDVEEVATDPVHVLLPRWYPDSVPLGKIDGPADRLEAPARPFVESVGAGKIVVRWELPTAMPPSLMWHLRLREVGASDQDFYSVDLDSGRAQLHSALSRTWKHRALVVQPGLRVWSFCIEAGRKSASPQFGTIVSHYPGLIVIDFDLTGRQRVPQDWVQYAATHKGAKAVQEEIVELLKEHEAGSTRPGARLWKWARQEWWRAADAEVRRRLRTRRQCPLLCNVWVDPPDPDDRVAVSCQLGFEEGQEALGERPGATSVYTWWPALVCKAAEMADDFVEDGMKDRPEDLCANLDVPVVLEPWPRVQVVPKAWLCRDTAEAERAAKNACPGQQVLARYSRDAVEASMEHPAPRRDVEGDATLLLAREESQPSERAVRCEVLRELVSPQEVHVVVRYRNNGRIRRLPLHSVCELPGTITGRLQRTSGKKKRVCEWLVVRAETRGWSVMARQREVRGGLLEEAVLLEPGVEVIVNDGPDGSRTHRGYQARIVRLNVKPSHYEVRFEDVVPSGTQFVSADTLRAVLEEDGPHRIQQPEVLVHDLPETLGVVEVQVGVSSGAAPTILQDEVLWSAPRTCTVRSRDPTLLAPLGPVAWPIGVSKAEVRWLFPEDPTALCFRVRLREVSSKVYGRNCARLDASWTLVEKDYAGTGKSRYRSEDGTYWVHREDGTYSEQSWELVNASGRSREMETTMAWTTNIVPLVKDLWILAYGNCEGQKATTPDAAVVYDIVDDVTVKIQFTPPSQELLIGSLGQQDVEDALGSLASSQELAHLKPQDIPVDWVEAAWVQATGTCLEGHKLKPWRASDSSRRCSVCKQQQPAGANLNGCPKCEYDVCSACADQGFVKGRPSASCKASQQVRFVATKKDKKDTFAVWLGADGLEIPNLYADAMFLSSSVFNPVIERDGVYAASATLGALTLHGLNHACDYEICVQALTEGGWTPWTQPGKLQMPKTSYEHAELVAEKPISALYKSPLLERAFYKQYDVCREIIQEALPEARYEAIRNVVEKQAKWSDPASRGKLVTRDGPIRLRNGEEARRQLRLDVESGADVNHHDKSTGRTPLIYACEYFKFGIKLEVVKELLELRADIDGMNDARRTALSVAAERGHSRIVRLLLEHRADATIVDREGRTAFLCAKVQPGMSREEIKEARLCRELLVEDRVPWEEFEQKVVSLWQDPPAAARAFLRLAFPGVLAPEKKVLFIPDASTKLGKRICKHDRLRLYEQIIEADHPEEQQRRGTLCGERLLLPQMSACSTAPAPKDCQLLTFYLLFSDVARYCIDEVHDQAADLLRFHETALNKMRGELVRLPDLLDLDRSALLPVPELLATASKATMYRGSRQKFNGCALHQWHAHGELPWLAEQNVVGAFEVLAASGAFTGLEDFCLWVGELNAQVCAGDADLRVQRGAWDPRLPYMFWGSVYVQWLMAEATRVAPVFHDIARGLVKKVGGSVTYEAPPNKGRSRVEAKQKDYASPGLAVLHEALDLMPGAFQRALRADGGRVQEVPNVGALVHQGAAVLVLGVLAVGDDIGIVLAAAAVTTAQEEAARARQASLQDAEAARQKECKAMEAALDSLRHIKRSSFLELSSLGSPPARLLLLVEALCRLLGLDPEDAQPEGIAGSWNFSGTLRRHFEGEPTAEQRFLRVTEYWYTFGQELLSDGGLGLLHKMEAFDKDHVLEDIITYITPLAENKDFEPQALQRTLPVCGPLSAWIRGVYRYHLAARKVRKLSDAAAGDSGNGTKTGPLVVAVLIRGEGVMEEDVTAAETKMIESGADAVVAETPARLEGGGARRVLKSVLHHARAARGFPSEAAPATPANLSTERAQVLFDIRKCLTGAADDLYCAGGLLDLVRGSIVCTTEEEVRRIYELAMELKIKDHGCEVVRVKNGFNTPSIGGYADLKLNLQIARDACGSEGRMLHVCELQVHLKSFLERKSYTHLPYQVDRGDFDPGLSDSLYL